MLAAVAAARTAQEDGAIAPLGAWITHGGSPARNRATATPVLRTMPHKAWTFAAPGEIEGDPLAWGELAFVAYREDGGRGLSVLDLRDGSTTARISFGSARAPLAPCVFGDLLLVREVGPNDALRAYRLSAGLREAWSATPRESFGPPLLYGDEVYVVDGDRLVRFHARDGSEAWRDGGAHHGRPSLRGDAVFVPGRDGSGPTVDVVARSDGTRRAAIATVATRGGVPWPEEIGGAFAAVMASEVALYLEHAIPWTPERATSVLVGTRGQPVARNSAPATWLFHRVEAAELPEGWLGSVESQALGGAFWFLSIGDGFVPFATAGSQPALAARTEAPCRAGEGAYLGGTAIELGTRQVLWRFAEPALGPLIPVRDALLVVCDARTLEAWRTRDPVGRSELAFGTAHDADRGVRLVGAGASLVDGSIEEGDLFIEERDGELTLVTLRLAGSTNDLQRRRRNPLAEANVVVDARDRVVFAASPTALLRGVDALIGARLAADYAELANDALPARDFALVARARARGASEKDVSRALKQLERNADRGAQDRKDDLAAPIEARLHALDGRRGERLVAMAKALPAEERDLRYHLLRGALLADPRQPDGLTELGALAPELQIALLGEVALAHPGEPAVEGAVRGLLPAGLEPSEPFETLEWLAFLEAVARAPVEIVEPKPAAADLGADERKLGSATLHWRKDLMGFRSANLFPNAESPEPKEGGSAAFRGAGHATSFRLRILTCRQDSEALKLISPVARPGAIARCLSTGELVCRALDEVFAGGEHRRDTRYPLYINLYETNDEYLEESASKGGHVGLGWTAGHFDELDNVSRLFLPSGDENFAEVQRVLVHELTHQWVRNRCPLFTSEEAASRWYEPPTGGHWIVEGFAALIEEFAFDPGAWTWTHENASSKRRDLAVGASDDQRVPWSAMLGGDARAFQALDKTPALQVPLRTKLGRFGLASEISLYYSQAQAVCYYLFAADSGARRADLLEYLAAYYRGDETMLDVAGAFGASPDDLGARALAFARESLP